MEIERKRRRNERDRRRKYERQTEYLRASSVTRAFTSSASSPSNLKRYMRERRNLEREIQGDREEKESDGGER